MSCAERDEDSINDVLNLFSTQLSEVAVFKCSFHPFDFSFVDSFL